MAKVNGTIQKDTVTSELIGNFGITGTKNFSPSETGGVSTGWISGGDITAIGDAAPDISAGVGYVYVTASDSYTRVAWNAVSNLTVTNNVVNYISVNSAGVVSATTAVPTSADQRTAIQLGRVSVTAGVITGITSTVVSIKQTAPQLYDLFKALGSTKLGLAITASSTNLKLAVASGEIFSQGVSAQTSVNAPNSAVFTGNNPQTYRMFTQTGASGGDITDLPVGDYDNGGTVTAIPGAGTQATIFTIYKFSSGNVRVFYGQTIYTNLSTAVQAIGSYNPVVPATFAEAIIIGYVAATKNATNLTLGTQAVFINTNRFGGVGGAVSSAGSFMFTDFSNKTAAVPISIGTFGSTPNSGGASYSADVITLQPASASFPGGVTTGTQAFAGDKTLSSGFFRVGAGTDNILVQQTSVIANNATNSLALTPNYLQYVKGANSALLQFPVTITGARSYNFPDATIDVAGLGSPAFTGTPTAPTATAGTNTTQLATTAFVTTAVGSGSVWTRSGTTLSPTTAGDMVSVSTSGGLAVSINGLATSGIGVRGDATTGIAGSFVNNATSGGNPSLYVANGDATGLIARFDNGGGLVSSIGGNGGYYWLNATATSTAGWDAAKNLVSITNTGTGNAVRATSPTLVTPNIGAATGTTLALTSPSTFGARLLSGASGSFTYLSIGRTAEEHQIGVPAGAGQFIAGSVAGDLVMNATTGKMMFGTGANPGITLSTAQLVRFNAYGAGTLTTDASGNITATSDRNAKKNFEPYTKGLEALRDWKPQTYNWREETGLDTVYRYTSLIAQDVQKTAPEGVFPAKEGGYLGVQDRVVQATIVNAINELRARLEASEAKNIELEARIKALEP